MTYSSGRLSITGLRSVPAGPACLRRPCCRGWRASWLPRPPPSGRRSLASTSIVLCSSRPSSCERRIDGSAGLRARSRAPCSALGCGRLLLHLLRLPVGDLAIGVLLAQGIDFLHLAREVLAFAMRVVELL